MKTAVITGASSGLGREFVRQFYSVFPEIERVWLIARRTDRLQELAEQLEVFADGTLDIFSHEQSTSEDNRFTVYGFSELGKRMRAMAMLVMIESITAKIKYNQSDGVATWVYIDEMHELWGEEYSLHALELSLIHI